ncbi:hypothetical protein HRG_012056 [Hirsutella rhossiliensis]
MAYKVGAADMVFGSRSHVRCPAWLRGSMEKRGNTPRQTTPEDGLLFLKGNGGAGMTAGHQNQPKSREAGNENINERRNGMTRNDALGPGLFGWLAGTVKLFLDAPPREASQHRQRGAATDQDGRPAPGTEGGRGKGKEGTDQRLAGWHVPLVLRTGAVPWLGRGFALRLRPIPQKASSHITMTPNDDDDNDDETTTRSPCRLPTDPVYETLSSERQGGEHESSIFPRHPSLPAMENDEAETTARRGLRQRMRRRCAIIVHVSSSLEFMLVDLASLDRHLLLLNRGLDSASHSLLGPETSEHISQATHPPRLVVSLHRQIRSPSSLRLPPANNPCRPCLLGDTGCPACSPVCFTLQPRSHDDPPRSAATNRPPESLPVRIKARVDSHRTTLSHSLVGSIDSASRDRHRLTYGTRKPPAPYQAGQSLFDGRISLPTTTDLERDISPMLTAAISLNHAASVSQLLVTGIPGKGMPASCAPCLLTSFTPLSQSKQGVHPSYPNNTLDIPLQALYFSMALGGLVIDSHRLPPPRAGPRSQTSIGPKLSLFLDTPSAGKPWRISTHCQQ